jgi:hypothetical protein
VPVNAANYDHRGAGNYGIVVRCPNLVGDRLVYFDHNATRGSWVIRDFITGQRLENSDSHLTVAQIEADANYDEFPPWYNAVNTADWSIYLTLRTTAVFRLGGAAVSTAAPNPASGTWRPL